MLRLSQIRGAWRIHQMIEASKWRATYGMRDRPLSDGDREYFSWFPISPRGVTGLDGQVKPPADADGGA